MIRKAIVLIVLALVSCSRKGAPEGGEVAPVVAPAKPKPKSTAPEEGGAFRLPEPERLIALGDVHGDWSAMHAALRLAGAIGPDDRWAGGKLVVVQVGDQLDRGDDERRIIDFLDELADQAAAAGGAVHVLNGNHETMNVAGDFRYVTPGGFTDFASLAGQLPPGLAARVPEHMRGRVAAFMPGGPYARRLAAHRVVVMVGTTVFAHGGVTPDHVGYGIDRLNRETSAWMRGESKDPPDLIMDSEGPVWTRIYSREDVPADCVTLERTLRALGAQRMVVAHTPQRAGITSACDEKVWRVDVGMAHHYGGPVEVLEVSGARVRALGERPAQAAE
jgi:hypothetical protein